MGQATMTAAWVETRRCARIHEGGRCVGEVEAHATRTPGEALALARKMAAAPALVDALRALVDARARGEAKCSRQTRESAAWRRQCQERAGTAEPDLYAAARAALALAGEETRTADSTGDKNAME